nr:DNA-directed DNA polymerase [Tanacetum cinerariifolium]
MQGSMYVYYSLKVLCTSKRKLKGDEEVLLGENVSAMIQKKLPIKCKDPCMFTIPCKMGNVEIERAMRDFGASINVMPRSIYEAMNVGKLKETGVIIQLVDRCFRVYISSGRPFLKTTGSNICVHEGTLTKEFDGQVIKFNIYDSMKYPSNEHSVFSIDFIDSLVQKVFELNDEDSIKTPFVIPDIPTPVVSTQGTHRSTPRAHRKPTVTAASPRGKKRKRSAGKTTSPMKSLKVTIKQKIGRRRLEPGSYKENPKRVDDNENEKEKKN